MEEKKIEEVTTRGGEEVWRGMLARSVTKYYWKRSVPMYGCYGFHLFSLMLYSFPFSRCFLAFVCFLNVDSIDYILVGGIWIVCKFAMVLFIWTYIWIIFGFFLDIRNSCSNSLLVSLVFSHWLKHETRFCYLIFWSILFPSLVLCFCCFPFVFGVCFFFLKHGTMERYSGLGWTCSVVSF